MVVDQLEIPLCAHLRGTLDVGDLRFEAGVKTGRLKSSGAVPGALQPCGRPFSGEGRISDWVNEWVLDRSHKKISQLNPERS
jgi:hypothetical protein